MGFLLNRFQFETLLSSWSTGYLYSFYKLFDNGWQFHFTICSSMCHHSGKTKHQRTEIKKKKVWRAFARTPIAFIMFGRQSWWGYIWLTTESGGNDPPQKNQWQNMVPPATESSTYKRLEFGAPIDISSLWYFDMEIMPSSLCFLRYLSLTWGKLKLSV